jgi:hypothetical protein
VIWKSEKDSDEQLLSSVFVLFQFTSPYAYNKKTFVEVLGLLSSPEGRSYQAKIDNLPKDRDYSIIIPEHIASIGLEFIGRVMREVRAVVCKKEKKRLVGGRSFPAVVSGLASSLTASLGISSALATGLAATVLVILAQAAHKSFCDMTDEQVLEAVEKKAGATRRQPSLRKS